jgi:hypothetical protein
MKLISSIILLFIMLGCDSKTKMVEPAQTKATQTIATTVTQEVKTVATIPTQEVEIVLEEQIDAQIYPSAPVVPNRTIVREPVPLIIHQPAKQEVRTITPVPQQLPIDYKEETKLVRIKGNIPSSCQMWTDGCNTCTRAKHKKANCTMYKCQSNIKFSCLQWN